MFLRLSADLENILFRKSVQKLSESESHENKRCVRHTCLGDVHGFLSVLTAFSVRFGLSSV